MNEEMMKMGEENTEGAQAAGAEEQAGAQGTDGQNQPEKKYTDADVDRIIAKKIAAERKKMQKLFEGEQQESELERRERDVLRRELTADARDKLIEDGLPSSLAKLMDYSSADDFAKSYKDVTEIFRAAVQQGVRNALRMPTPRAGMGPSGMGPSEDAALQSAFAPKAR